MDILDKIDLLRKERGWSINYMATEAMLTQSTVNNLYNRKSEPKISTLRALCSAFGISLSEFFSDESAVLTQSDNEALLRKIEKLTPEKKKALLALLS